MKSRRVFRRCLLAASAMLGTGLAQTQVFASPQTEPNTLRQAPVPAQADRQEDFEVLTRGPVHEAFAETVAFNPEAGIVVTAMPPEPIEELPPEQRPEGTNVTWIPGYFAWDDERGDFLWVSGIWRDIPPGRQWVPGYWAEVGQEAQWISGYWADATRTEIQYLPEPPASNELGPNVAAPSHDHTWLPGCWVWHQSRYAWRPGYWMVMPAEWDWIPPHYVWTPRGYVFVDGYYDYAVTHRGTLFCPVYFHADVYTRRNYTHSPTIVVNLNQFTSHLFWRPHYHHYYFGDYYAANYSNTGFFPWFSFASNSYGYDPFYTRQRRQHGQDRDWLRQTQQEFEYRRDHEDARPPRTLAAQKSQPDRPANSAELGASLAVVFDDLTSAASSGQQFRRIEKSEREQLAQRSQEIRKFRDQRQQLEAKTNIIADTQADQTGRTEPKRLNLPPSPILSEPRSQSGGKVKLPESQEAPPVDMNVEPKPRQPRAAGQDPRSAKDRPEIPDMKRNRPGENSKPESVPGADPQRGKKGDPSPNKPKMDRPGDSPRPSAPKADPKPEVPRPSAPKADPKPEVPRPGRPKVDPKPDTPRPGTPKLDPKPDTPRPGRPKVDPKPDTPRPGTPKVDPKPDTPRPGAPKIDPKPEVPDPVPQPLPTPLSGGQL